MFQLVILACLLLSFCKYGESEQVFIIPSLDSPCPEETCYTLMQYINLTSLCQSSEVALTFMPGNHILGMDFTITSRSCFSMSVYDNASSSCSIMCINSSRMALSYVEIAVISGVYFINCGGNTARSVNSFILKRSNFTMDPPHSYMFRRRAWSVIGSETLIIDNCTFITNAASYRGGALYISAVTNAVITLCTFNNNTAAGGGGQGGAVYINAINSIINESTFFNNTIRGGGAQGGAVYVNAAMNFIIYRSIVTNNKARGGGATGGGLYVTATNSVINGTIFRNNMAFGGGADGGAFYVNAANSVIGMSTFINNAATHGAPWRVNAKTSTVSPDATYEGIQWQNQNFNITLNDGICGEDNNYNL